MFRKARRHLPARAELVVAVVGGNPGTLDGLHRYLGRAGVEARSASALEQASTVARGASAVVVFPDDFDHPQALRTLLALESEDPSAVLVVVTSRPNYFTPLRAGDADKRVVLLPRPAWGWTILDAIVGCLDEDATTRS